jgi:hypothetical protein
MPRPANSTFNSPLGPKTKKGKKELPPDQWAIPPDEPIPPPAATRFCQPHWDAAARDWIWPPTTDEAKVRLRRAQNGKLPNAWSDLPKLGEEI